MGQRPAGLVQGEGPADPVERRCRACLVAQACRISPQIGKHDLPAPRPERRDMILGRGLGESVVGDQFHALVEGLHPLVGFDFLAVSLFDPDRNVMRVHSDYLPCT